MAHPHDIRKIAFQALFQLDAVEGSDVGSVREMAGSLADEAGLKPADALKAYNLAVAAYEKRRQSDRMSGSAAPEWPAHRQPAPDRAIIRLALYEATEERVPMKVAIDEAVELAKEFGTEKSPAFVNGVLDAALRKGAGAGPAAAEQG